VEGELSKVEPSSSRDLSAEQADSKDLPTDQAGDPELISREPSGQLVYQSYGFSGPIPPPEIFAGYDKALPNGADRVMKMAEREQEHRHKIEEIIIRKESFEKRAGLVSAFTLAILALGVSAYLLIFTDKSGTGLTLFIIQFVGLALAFLRAKKQQAIDEAQESED
jgi:uncharacterized membrane protein